MAFRDEYICIPVKCFPWNYLVMPLEEKGAFFLLLCHALKVGGKVWTKQGGGVPPPDYLSKLLQVDEKRCSEILASLVKYGAITIDAEGVYYNKEQYKDALSNDKKEGGEKSSTAKQTPLFLPGFEPPTVDGDADQDDGDADDEEEAEEEENNDSEDEEYNY